MFKHIDGGYLLTRLSGRNTERWGAGKHFSEFLAYPCFGYPSEVTLVVGPSLLKVFGKHSNLFFDTLWFRCDLE